MHALSGRRRSCGTERRRQRRCTSSRKTYSVETSPGACRGAAVFCREHTSRPRVSDVDEDGRQSLRSRRSTSVRTDAITTNACEVLVARWYDPTTGQWMSLDQQVMNTQSAIAYVNN